MSDEKVSRVQKTQDAWKKMVDDQVTRVEGFYTEAARYEGQGFDHAKGAMDDLAKLSKDTFAYWGQLTSEWRKLSLEATRRAAEMVSPKA